MSADSPVFTSANNLEVVWMPGMQATEPFEAQAFAIESIAALSPLTSPVMLAGTGVVDRLRVLHWAFQAQLDVVNTRVHHISRGVLIGSVRTARIREKIIDFDDDGLVDNDLKLFAFEQQKLLFNDLACLLIDQTVNKIGRASCRERVYRMV